MKRMWFVSLLCVGGCLFGTGCTQQERDRWLAQNTENARELHAQTRALVDAHDENVTAQHIVQSPEVEDPIRELRAELKVVLDSINVKADEVHSPALEGLLDNELVGMLLQLAGVGGLGYGGLRGAAAMANKGPSRGKVDLDVTKAELSATKVELAELVALVKSKIT